MELVTERSAKSRDGSDYRRDARDVVPKVWATGHPTRCPVHLYNVWKDKRPPDACQPDSPFYLEAKWGKQLDKSPYWYWPRPMGKNQISSMVSKACDKAGINKKKPHGVSKTCMHTMSKAKVPRHHMKQISGHKSESSIDHYDKMDSEQHREVSAVLTKSMALHSPKAISGPALSRPKTAAAAAESTTSAAVSGSGQPLTTDSQSIVPVSSSVDKSMDSLFRGATLNNCVFNLTVGSVAGNMGKVHSPPGNSPKPVAKRRRILPLFDDDSDFE